ncbi:hypothetical protein C8R46DRAFT_1135199 [Mycena filopes]|nr:hypothetical protein C8R46DRAFT_1135199 [Mycena filopes]
MRQFPPELIDAVIRENHDDIPTLRSSALVCRAFLPSSQACIFSVVELVAFKQTALRLHKTLVQSPHLCRHVKTLRITRLALYGYWSIWSPYVALILGLIQDVTSFTLTFTRFHRSNWDTLPEGLRVSLCEFCRRSHLRSLELLHLGELADLSQFAQLVTSPLLTRISLLGLSLELPLPHPTMPHPSPQLNQCQLYLRPPTLDTVARWLIGGGAFANIRELGFLWDDDTAPPSRPTSPSLQKHSPNPLPQVNALSIPPARDPTQPFAGGLRATTCCQHIIPHRRAQRPTFRRPAHRTLRIQVWPRMRRPADTYPHPPAR